ncbi:unnamed protein product, partial [Urochloa humidicola]
ATAAETQHPTPSYHCTRPENVWRPRAPAPLYPPRPRSSGVPRLTPPQRAPTPPETRVTPASCFLRSPHTGQISLRAPCDAIAMAPTAPVATGAASPATPAVAKRESKATAAARSVGPALPGLGLVAQGGQQTRGASFCKRLGRNVVVAMAAAGEPASAPLAANDDHTEFTNEQLTEFVNALKQEWDGIKNKYTVTTLAFAATLGMWSAGGVVSALDRLPVVPGIMEIVGIGYSGWFAYRNLLFKPDRDAFFAKVMEFYEDIISG